MKRLFFVAVIHFLCLLAYAGNELDDGSAFMPMAPDYQDDTMWITSLQDTVGTGADIFYVVSTWEIDWPTADGRVSHHADVWNPLHREHMAIEMNGVAAYMAPGNNFYAPFYRHATIDGWVTRDENIINHRFQPALTDVKQAFDEFQRRRDSCRPFVIAGFSQGGKAVVELLKCMDDSTYRQLVAAYVMGYKVTPHDTLMTKHIRAAQDSADIGVTICYNTVKDVKYINPIIGNTCMGINPVNWRTDATPAVLHDTITVTLDSVSHVLVVENYSGAEYPPYQDFINVGDIHGCEPWLYSDCIRRNIALRTREWWKKRFLQHPCLGQKASKGHFVQ